MITRKMSLLFFLSLSFFFLHFSSSSLSSPLPPSLNPDLLGLIVLKSSLSDPTSSLSSWSEDSPDPCSFPFVRCQPNTARVSSLSLSRLSLSGRLSRGLLQLRLLRSLSLSSNNLSGPLLPSLLPSLPHLTYLDLSLNSLSGPLPASFFQQCGTTLRSLSLAANRLSGPIPPSLASCRSLVTLNLSSNSFAGSLPAALSALPSLKSLDLSRNRLGGEVLALLGAASRLRSLDLGGNALTGALPETMRKLRMLTLLSLRGNALSGEVPEWIGELGLLRSLDLSGNGFSGPVPDAIGRLRLLKRLDLSNNAVTGSLPEAMAGCRGLREVDFGGNDLVGGVPDWVFVLGLRKFSAPGNRMRGYIRFPEVYDRSLAMLDLSGNEFSGWIPTEIGNLASLEFLNLSGNAFSGPVPASLWWLESMEAVDLSGNALNGSIPAEIERAAALKDLRLEKNLLTGEIPSQIGNCTSLTSLMLAQNNLSGLIPPTLANLTNLQTVDLSINSLTGALPKSLSNLARLSSFNVSHNLLSGPLPAGNFFDTIPPSSLSDNPGLCGSVVGRSCSSVLPKPIVLNPNSSSRNPHSNPVIAPANLRHNKIILSISALIAIGAAALIALGVVVITILNARARTSSSPSAVALTVSEESLSHSSASSPKDSGKLVMFSGDDPDFAFGAQAILNKDTELGRGGFGAVYKTVLRDGRPVAIKKLTVSSLVKSQEDFEKEIKKLGKIRHPNLVSLQGYYWTPSLQLLIYEFLTGGSLYRALHESSDANSLSWNERFDIILGTARSLAHLHRHNVIHYNLKSSNVLIDGSGEPKVGDYGLAKLLPMLDRYVLSSKVQSALGYMAPEFACRTVKITEKCDVYGFGVLVLEVVTGRRPVEYTEDDVVVLCDVVRGAVEGGKAEDCVDGRLTRRFPEEEAVPVIKLGLVCTSQVPSNRPEMGEVVKILEMIRCPQEALSSA